jgi:ornithine carbamoyltransferase
VINGLTDLLHPCQVLADLLTIKEKLGRLEGLKVAYVGDGNNVAHSLMLGCSKMGINIYVGTPSQYRPMDKILKMARENAVASGGSVHLFEDPAETVKDADVIYTDVWASMGQEEEKEKRKAIFSSYQVNRKLLELALPGALVMHCLPAYRGWEISADVLDGRQSVVVDQAENRLHAQKALMAMLM